VCATRRVSSSRRATRKGPRRQRQPPRTAVRAAAWPLHDPSPLFLSRAVCHRSVGADRRRHPPKSPASSSEGRWRHLGGANTRAVAAHAAGWRQRAGWLRAQRGDRPPPQATAAPDGRRGYPPCCRVRGAVARAALRRRCPTPPSAHPGVTQFRNYTPFSYGHLAR